MSAEPIPVSEKRILIIEADATLQEEWANGLRDYGFKVASTGDGDDGFSKAEKARPDVVLLRVELPNVNGYKLVKKFKEHDLLKDVPLILLSSSASDSDFENHKRTKSKAQAYRKIPVSFDDVLEDVENLVGLPGPAMAEFQAEAVPAEKYNALEAERSELLVQIDHVKEELESSKQENARLQQRMHELEKDLGAKAGAAADALQNEINSLRGEVEAIKTERDESREELDSKKRIINRLKENITKLEAETGKIPQFEQDANDLREELEGKKKVVAKLKEKIEQLEKNPDLEALRDDVESKKKVVSKLKEKIEQLERDLQTVTDEKKVLEAEGAKEAKEAIARLKETIADLTITADEAKRAAQKAKAEKEEILEGRAGLEKQHQKELDALKQMYEPRVQQVKAAEKELDHAKEKVRGLERQLDEEARKNRERDDEYAERLANMKRDQTKEMLDQGRQLEDLKKTVARLEDEKSKMEARVVKAYRKLRADEAQLDKVRKALEIAMNMTKSEAAKKEAASES